MIPPNESFLFMIFDNTLLFGFFQRTSNIISLAFFIYLLTYPTPVRNRTTAVPEANKLSCL